MKFLDRNVFSYLSSKTISNSLQVQHCGSVLCLLKPFEQSGLL